MQDKVFKKYRKLQRHLQIRTVKYAKFYSTKVQVIL